MSSVLTQMESRTWWQRTFFYELADDAYNSPYGLARRVLPSDSTVYEHWVHKPAFDHIRGVAPARLAVLRAGGGTVTSDPPGIACGPRCVSTFTRGETVTLTASPSSALQRWDGACTGTGPCTVTLDGAKSVVATFAPFHYYHLRLYPAGSALPTASTINYAAGQTRANNAIVSLGAGGRIAVRCAQAEGTAQFILDVSGYFE